MTPDVAEIARKYITLERPFGPTISERVENVGVAKLLFESESVLYKRLLSSPTIIVGRRGAGKTAFLESVYFLSPRDLVIEIKQAELFAKVSSTLEPLMKLSLTESAAAVWSNLLLTVAFQQLVQREAKSGMNLRITRDYLAKVGVSEIGTPDEVLWNIANWLVDTVPTEKIGIAAAILSKFTTTTFEQSKVEIAQQLKAKRARCVILLDSLEQYPLAIPEVAYGLQGLLHSIGGFSSPESPFVVRLCLPGELFHPIYELAGNNLKDFESSVTLHWHASELLGIVAARIALYQELWEPGEFRKKQHLQPMVRADARALFESVFPKSITNALGFDETTLGYVMRHSQLLPRQILRLLNRISEVNRALGGSNCAIAAEAVVAGVQLEEHSLVEEIFSAYRVRHPSAKAVCEACIPNLALEFNRSRLQKTYNEFGRSKFGGESFEEFRRMLVEIGAIGRVTNRTGRYVEARFEYTEPFKLTISNDDSMCLHPLFAGRFAGDVIRKRAVPVTVYPYGADVQMLDWRTAPS